MHKAIAVLVCLTSPLAAQENGVSVVPKQPVYSLELNQDDRDRMDELIVELRQMNTRIKKIMTTNEQEPRKPQKPRRRSRRSR